MNEVFVYNATATYIDKDGNKTQKSKMFYAKHPTSAMKKAKVTFLKPEMEDLLPKETKEMGQECIRACRFIKISIPETITIQKLEVENAEG